MGFLQNKRFVSLARFSRVHGRGPTPKLKFQNFHSDLSLLKSNPKLYLVSEVGELLSPESLPVQELKPHGGTWTRAPFVLVELSKEVTLPKTPFCLGIEREALPPLATEKGEVYLWDLLGKKLFNEDEKMFGVIEEVFQNSAGHCFVESSQGFSFPLEWMDFDRTQQHQFEKIFVPQIEAWILNPKEAPDDSAS